MPNLMMATMREPGSNGISFNGSSAVDPTDHAAILRELFGVRGNVAQLHDHFVRRSQHQLTRFARTFTPGALGTSCDQIDTGTANQVQAACVAYDADAKDVQTTVSTLRLVLERVDREIEMRVNLCGDEARCIISDELLRTNSELVVADATLGQKQEWLKRLEVLSVRAENPAPVAQPGLFAASRVGAYQPNTAVMETRELFHEETPSGSIVREQILETSSARATATKPRSKR